MSKTNETGFQVIENAARDHGRQGLGQADAAHNGVDPDIFGPTQQACQHLIQRQPGRADAQGHEQGRSQGQCAQGHDQGLPGQITLVLPGHVAVIGMHQRTGTRMKASSEKALFISVNTGLPTTKE